MGAGAGMSKGPVKGDTVKTQLLCTLEELYLGCSKRLKVTRKRLNRIEETLKRQQDNFDVNVDRQLQRIRKTYPPSDVEGKPSAERRIKE